MLVHLVSLQTDNSISIKFGDDHRIMISERTRKRFVKLSTERKFELLLDCILLLEQDTDEKFCLCGGSFDFINRRLGVEENKAKA